MVTLIVKGRASRNKTRYTSKMSLRQGTCERRHSKDEIFVNGTISDEVFVFRVPSYSDKSAGEMYFFVGKCISTFGLLVPALEVGKTLG